VLPPSATAAAAAAAAGAAGTAGTARHHLQDELEAAAREERTWEHQPASHAAAAASRLHQPPAGGPTTAVFYSISSTQRGLTGVDLGNFLIKQVGGLPGDRQVGGLPSESCWRPSRKEAAHWSMWAAGAAWRRCCGVQTYPTAAQVMPTLFSN